MGSSLFRGSTSCNKEYLKFFPLLNSSKYSSLYSCTSTKQTWSSSCLYFHMKPIHKKQHPLKKREMILRAEGEVDLCSVNLISPFFCSNTFNYQTFPENSTTIFFLHKLNLAARGFDFRWSQRCHCCILIFIIYSFIQ